jgi:hypothetical protein
MTARSNEDCRRPEQNTRPYEVLTENIPTIMRGIFRFFKKKR